MPEHPPTGKRWAAATLICTAWALCACNAGTVVSGAAPQPTTAAAVPEAGCKRGIAYNAGSPADFAALGAGANWFYSWSVKPTSAALAQDTNLASRFVPMLWGSAATRATTAQDLPRAKYLLTFNEPNFTAQANLTPQAAAELWPQVEALAQSQNMAIVSPAVNNCSGACTVASPFDWLDQFFASCANCRVDAIAVHAYSCVPADVQVFLKTFETRYKRPLWVTEFACLDTPTPTAAQQLDFMRAMVPLLEADPMVQRYAWFTGRYPDASAVDVLAADGTLTPLGQAYMVLPQTCRP